MSGGEVELPPVVQEELQETFDRERHALLSKLDDLNTERENSQQAFDKYRERARVSLMKTATELQAAQGETQDMLGRLKVRRLHCVC
jgi:hypothetical protein